MELSSLDIEYAESLQASLSGDLTELPRRKRQSVLVDGFSLYAAVHLHANDREGLEKLCGYGARPPFALERLSVLPDGRVCYRLKRPIADGRTELLLAPTEFLLSSMAIPPAVAKAPTRIPWAELLERVFRIDVLRCERCGGRMTLIAFLTERASVKKVLEHLGLPTTGPPIAKARNPVEFDFAS